MRIVGFGACMIAGYPFNTDISFFTQFINQLKEDHYNVDFSQIVSLGGFPINRAKKYLTKKVINLKPDAVVLQFGTTDISTNIRKSLSRKFKLKYSSDKFENLVSQNPLKEGLFFSICSFFKYAFKDLFIKIFKIEPITPIDTYISSLEQMIDILNKSNIKVLVLAPFIQHNYFVNKKANDYSEKVRKLIKDNNVIFVDCNNELLKYKKSDIFLCDGTHLTPKAHLILASKLKDIFEQNIEN